MDDILIITCIIVFALGYYVGEAVALFKVRQQIRKFTKILGYDIDEEIRKSQEDIQIIRVRKLETEVVNNVLYLYDKETRDFICQGSSMSELAELAKERKNIVGAVVTHGEQVFMFADGKSEEYKFQ